ncbi:type II toxin-antitoxin system HicB family antitoxin [Faecalibacterium sp. IP-3-29]|uniref:type II toxin-antitoxin system HicB family antitoxin n=1 Tax=Faecalibacterium sp. IP-3-29 TaxID=2929489 RepID=UPI002014B932|nr:type II toxin-antitoxin system HicB family antitoxin [Faecalibacterium sp. IP-3-29]UQK51549.1 type II toxin-antitoxin system HicB family antitoxin [Faecalibacterium sp. IP-3-29]
MKASYPVILTPAGRGYVVFVPNLNINTEGGTLAEALDMARDAISIWGITEQDAGRTIPEASDTMPTAVGGQIVRRVEVDFEAYRRGATAYPACFYKENDGYSVIFPDLNYLATQGDNFGDAMQMVLECLVGYLRAAQRDGDAIPVPSDLRMISPAGCVGCVHQSAGRVRAAALPERGGYVGLGFFPTSSCNARGRVCTGPLLARAAYCIYVCPACKH